MEFFGLLQSIHGLAGTEVVLGYADVHGDLLPINNDDNFHRAVASARPLLRIIITKKGQTGECLLPRFLEKQEVRGQRSAAGLSIS